MAKRLITEFGQSTSLRRQDPTAAARRAIENALWRNSINLAELFGVEKEQMQITVEVGVPDAERLDAEALKAAFPYGQVTVMARPGGLSVPRASGPPTYIAIVAISVALEGIA